MKTFLRASLLALASFAATCAFAQPKPALVQDRDDPGRDPFQAMAIALPADCNAIGCAVTFPAVPAGKRLVITHIAVIADAASGDLAFVKLSHNGGNPVTLTWPISRVSVPAGLFLNVPVTFFVDAGASPTIGVQLTDATELIGTLVGHYVTLP